MADMADMAAVERNAAIPAASAPLGATLSNDPGVVANDPIGQSSTSTASLHCGWVYDCSLRCLLSGEGIRVLLAAEGLARSSLHATAIEISLQPDWKIREMQE